MKKFDTKCPCCFKRLRFTLDEQTGILFIVEGWNVTPPIEEKEDET